MSKFPTHAIARAVELLKGTEGKLYILLITDELIFRSIKSSTAHAVSPNDIQELEEAIDSQLSQEGSRLLEVNISSIVEQHAHVVTKTIRGDSVQTILNYVDDESIDLIVIENQSDILLDDSIFVESTVPIWVERGGGIREMMVISTNLSPNTKVPILSDQLSDLLNVKRKFFYVIDTPTRAESEKGQQVAKDFYMDLDREGVLESSADQPEIKEGNISKEVIRKAQEWHPDLIILGRIRKPRIFRKEKIKVMQSKRVSKLPYNLLLVN